MSLGVTQRARIKPWLDRGILVYVFDCTLDPLYVILLALFNDVTMMPVAEDTGGIPGVDFLGDNFILGQTFILQVRPRRGPYVFFFPLPHLTELRLERLKKIPQHPAAPTLC